MADETIKLKNPETAALYDVHTATTYDFRIMSPGLYKGPLSEVPPNVAKILVEEQKYWRLIPKAATAQNNQDN